MNNAAELVPSLSPVSLCALSVTLQKAFTQTVIGPGGTTQLQFTVSNTAGPMSRSDLGVVDTLGGRYAAVGDNAGGADRDNAFHLENQAFRLFGPRTFRLRAG